MTRETGREQDRLVVEVPASSANLGPGFDAVALALDVVDRFTIEPAEDLPAGAIELTAVGEAEGLIPVDGSGRFGAALGRAAGGLDRGWRVRLESAIPVARGLGSSAAATVAGLLAGRAIAGGPDGRDDDLLALATELEGHPENAAASLLGGLVVAVAAGARVRAVRVDPPPSLVAVAYVPQRRLATDGMRAVLPSSVPRADAVANVGRASLLVAAFATGRLEVLDEATRDRLHEPHRAAVFPELPALLEAAREAGALGACLSGAGSSVLAFADDDALAQRLASALSTRASTLALPGRALVLRPRHAGAQVRGADRT